MRPVTVPTLTTLVPVLGIDCARCARAVEEEVLALPGVVHASVTPDRAWVTVTSSHPVDRTCLAEAVADAGVALALDDPENRRVPPS